MQGSSNYLCLSASWPTARYHAQEWPPAPARVFQALIAGIMTGCYRQEIAPLAKPALEWLETLPAPLIGAKTASKLSEFRISVPNNDLDKVALAWSKGNAADPAKLRTLKTIAPRALPTEGSQVHYFWRITPEGQPRANEFVEALRQAAHCLHTLGWGIDMAFADLSLESSLPSLPKDFELWQPGPRGTPLAVPIAGFLADLEASYARAQKRIGPDGVNADTRPRHYGVERYQRVGRQERPYCGFALRPLDLSAASYFRYPPHRAVDVAAWFRHAAQKVAEDQGETHWIPYISGHVEGKDPGDRLSYVPLPSIGAPKADAFLRRVLLFDSPEADGEVTKFLAHALNGRILTDPSGQERCQISPLPPSDSLLKQYLPQSAAQLWHSVTPVVLHGHNTLRKHFSLEKTDKLLQEAFRKSGFPPELVENFFIQSAPLVPQLPGATQFFLPEHLRRFPRYHVGVRFKDKVHGPVLVGIGRHYGLGLFRPIE
ncbi:MAG: type I-U CRISPR-associated protein Csb2 [Bryobacter sp.]